MAKGLCIVCRSTIISAATGKQSIASVRTLVTTSSKSPPTRRAPLVLLLNLRLPYGVTVGSSLLQLSHLRLPTGEGEPTAQFCHLFPPQKCHLFRLKQWLAAAQLPREITAKPNYPAQEN